MTFKSKDIRAVYDELTVDPLWKDYNKPYVEEKEIVRPSCGGFTLAELDYYREARAKRLAAMYAEIDAKK